MVFRRSPSSTLVSNEVPPLSPIFPEPSQENSVNLDGTLDAIPALTSVPTVPLISTANTTATPTSPPTTAPTPTSLTTTTSLHKFDQSVPRPLHAGADNLEPLMDPTSEQYKQALSWWKRAFAVPHAKKLPCVTKQRNHYVAAASRVLDTVTPLFGGTERMQNALAEVPIVADLIEEKVRAVEQSHSIELQEYGEAQYREGEKEAFEKLKAHLQSTAWLATKGIGQVLNTDSLVLLLIFIFFSQSRASKELERKLTGFESTREARKRAMQPRPLPQVPLTLGSNVGACNLIKLKVREAGGGSVVDRNQQWTTIAKSVTSLFPECKYWLSLMLPINIDVVEMKTNGGKYCKAVYLNQIQLPPSVCQEIDKHFLGLVLENGKGYS